MSQAYTPAEIARQLEASQATVLVSHRSDPEELFYTSCICTY
jgi:hypothetical protein